MLILAINSLYNEMGIMTGTYIIMVQTQEALL